MAVKCEDMLGTVCHMPGTVYKFVSALTLGLKCPQLHTHASALY